MDIGISFCLFGKKPGATGVQALISEEERFAQCAQNGIHRVELALMEGYITPGDWPAIGKMRRLAEQQGITIHSVHGPSGSPTTRHWLADPDEAARRRNVADRIPAMEGTLQLGARYMVVEFEAYDQWPVWPHGQKPEITYPQAVDQWRRSFDELLAAAGRLGLTLAVEIVDGAPNHLLPSLMSGLSVSEAGICFDTSHALYGGDFMGLLKSLAPSIIATHLSDNDDLPGNAYLDRHWIPFTGVVDWPAVVREISTRSPCDCLMFEVHDPTHRQITPAYRDAINRLHSLCAAHPEGRS